MPVSSRFGFSLIEITIVFGIISILSATATLVLNPPYLIAKARDSKRLSELAVLASAINEYIVDNGTPPGSFNLHLSDFLPQGQTGPLQSAKEGWIEGDFSKYIRMLYTDPTNEGDLVYRYKRNDFSFEIDCALEALTDKYLSDSGNSDSRYEVGTDLTLL